MRSTTRAKPTSGHTPSTAGAVIILSRLQMVSETVAAALRARGFEADEMAWALGIRGATHDLTESDSVLLIDDLEGKDFGLGTQYLVAQCPARFLVLTARPEGPCWGALLACGVAAVMSSQSSLDDVAAALTLVRQGASPMVEGRRADLVCEWVNWLAGDTDEQAAPVTDSAPSALVGVRPVSPRAPSTSEQ